MLLCITVCISMLPMTAYAVDVENAAEKAAIQLGTSGISSPTGKHPVDAETNVEDETKTYYEPNSYIYFGADDSKEPIKWRVLDADNANNGDKGMFLLSEYLLGNTESGGTEWQGSDAQSWCIKFAGNDDVFLKPERDAVLSVGKGGQSEGKFYEDDWGKSSLNKEKDKIFFLSASELANYVGNYDDAPGMLPAKDPKRTWWLRSRQSSSMVGIVHVQNLGGGVVDGVYVSVSNKAQDYAARPAFNLNLDQILFTSAAKDIKTAGTIGTLATVGSNDTNEWKLTLLDSSRSGFSISNVALEGQKASFNYTGAITGTNEYLSAIIVKNGTVSYYGHLLHLDGTTNGTDGGATVTLPEGVTLNANTQLLVFNEYCNDNYRTDYSSKLITVQPEITEIKANVTDPQLGEKPSTAVNFITTPDSNVTNYNVTWYKVPKADYVDGQGSDSWETMENDEVFKSDFCYSVSILADIPSGYALSPDVAGSVNNKSHDTKVYGSINYKNKIYLRVDFDPALVAADQQLYYDANTGNLYTNSGLTSEYSEQADAWSSSQSKGNGKYDTLTLNGFALVTKQPVALTIIGMNADETFTIKETSGALKIGNFGVGLRITGGSILAGASGGISTNSKLTLDGGALFATSTGSGYAIKADGDILLKNTVLANSLAAYKVSPSSNGIQTNGTLNIENAYVRAGKITATNGIYVREYIEVHNLLVDKEVANQTDSQGQSVSKEVRTYDKNRSYFVIDGRWRVKFDSNGGTWTEDEIYPVTKDQFIQFPTKAPVKDGYTFSGWFTSANGGKEIKAPCRYTPGTAEDRDYKLSPQTAGQTRDGGIIPTLYAHWTSNTSGGSVVPVTPVQKPEIQPVSGGKTELSKDGSTLEITPDEGMEIDTVTVNGKEVTVKDGKITGLKTGDKVQVTFIAKAPSKAEADQKAAAMVKDLKLTVKTSRTANKNIKATVQMNSELAAAVKELKAAGYKVQYKFYRSIKKASAYERMLIKDAPRYVNTIGDKDTYYYYKVRLAVYDQDGKLIAQTALKQCKAGNRIWVK